MKVFTCITEVRNSFHVSQHAAQGPDAALREHIAALPFDDGDGPFDEELDWLGRVGEGTENIELLPVVENRNTWLWLDGSKYEPPYSTYIVKTDVRE